MLEGECKVYIEFYAFPQCPGFAKANENISGTSLTKMELYFFSNFDHHYDENNGESNKKFIIIEKNNKKTINNNSFEQK